MLGYYMFYAKKMPFVYTWVFDGFVTAFLLYVIQIGVIRWKQLKIKDFLGLP